MEYRRVQSISGKGSAAHQFAEALRGIAVDGADRVYAVGDESVKVFDRDGALLGRWSTRRPGYSVAVSGKPVSGDAVGGDRRVWVGQYQQVEIFDGSGVLADTWAYPDRLGLVTAIGIGGEGVFLADAHARCIHRYDRKGEFLNEIGDKHRKGGFHIPNGVVDFALDGAGVLHVANPGMHRVERWTAAGELLGHFGRFDGTDPAGFPGCCNPTNLTVDRAARVIVSEKAIPRAKVYDADGKLLAVIADRGFAPGAKNMDIAVDSTGRVYVADTVELAIRVFEPAVGENEP